MAKARLVLGVQLVVGFLGLGVTALAIVAVASRFSGALPTAERLWVACRQFVLPSATLADVATLGLAIVSLAVIVLAVRSAARQLLATRRFLRSLGEAYRLHDGGTEVTVVDDDRPLAFCAGLLRPRIYISTTTRAALDAGELSVVLTHEAHHASERDPLRVFVSRVLADALFFLPVARRVGRRYEQLAEIAADQAALRLDRDDGRRNLASALLGLEASGSVVVGIAPERVDHLMGEKTPWDLPLALLAAGAAVIAALAAVALRVQASPAADLNLPVVLAESCMLAMAVIPPLVGAAILVRLPRACRMRRPVRRPRTPRSREAGHARFSANDNS